MHSRARNIENIFCEKYYSSFSIDFFFSYVRARHAADKFGLFETLCVFFTHKNARAAINYARAHVILIIIISISFSHVHSVYVKLL